MKLLITMIILGLAGCNNEKFEPQLQEAKTKYLMISHGPTANPRLLRAFDTELINNFAIWDSKDGTICEVSTYGDGTARLDCTTEDGMATENAVDCKKGISKDNPIIFFIGGVDRYNQNFYFWCE